LSRSLRSALTFGAGVFGQIVTMIAGFVITPLLLSALGDVRYGAFRAASDWTSYLSLLELGIGGALQALLARALGSDNRTGIVAIVRAGMRAYFYVAGLMFFAGLALAFAMPVLVPVPEDLVGELRFGTLVGLLCLTWLPLAPFRPLAEAGQRGYLINLLLMAQSLTTVVLSLGLAWAGWGIVGQFTAVFAGGLPFYLGVVYFGLRRYPEVLARNAVGKVPGSLWGLSWPNLVFNIAGRIGLLTDNILIAAILGPSAVTSFLLTQRLVVVAQGQAQAIGGAAWAGLIDLHFRGEHVVFARRLEQLTRLTSTVAVALLGPLAVWNHEIIQLWVGSERYAGATVTWLAAGNAWCLAVMSIFGWPLTAAGNVRSVVPVIATASLLNISLSVAATLVVGLPGPLIGSAAGFLFVASWWTMRLLTRHFQLSAWRLTWAAFRPLLVGLPLLMGYILVDEFVPPFNREWPRWACWLALTGWLSTAATLYLVAAWWLAVPAADRTEWQGRIRNRFAKR